LRRPRSARTAAASTALISKRTAGPLAATAPAAERQAPESAERPTSPSRAFSTRASPQASRSAA
jgi:hypothetical protein